MSKLGIRWKIDDVPAAFVTPGAFNGRYCVTFERSEASLDQIEHINWSAPAITRVSESQTEFGLPAGYGFQLMDIRYQRTSQTFIADLQTAQQFWGDVAAYQSQVQSLSETLAEQTKILNDQASQLVTMTTDMENAYAEGVDRVG